MAKDTRAKSAGKASGPARRRRNAQRSEIADDLLTFAENLRANATEAVRFVEDKLAKRLGWGTKKNAETRFFSRATHTSRDFSQRRQDFDALDARCRATDACRPLIDDLAGGGLREAIEIVAVELSNIAARAGRPFNDADRDQLHNELQGAYRMLQVILEFAEWIEDEARILRGGSVPGRRRLPDSPPLPPEIQEPVLEAESAARQFMSELEAAPPELACGSQESTLAYLKRLGPEKSRLERESNKVTAIVKKFTDEQREAAERQGHSLFLQFLNDAERHVTRVAVRRAFSNATVCAVIDRLVSRLALTDEGSHSASRILVMAEDLKRHLQSDQHLLGLQAEQVTNERRANEVTAGELPDWSEVIGPGGDDAPSEQAMLLMAFVEYDGDEPVFEVATKYELAARLGCIFPDRRRQQKAWLSWIDRHLPKLKKAKIVFAHDREEGSSRRLADCFEICPAAVRKYRRHLIRSRAAIPTA